MYEELGLIHDFIGDLPDHVRLVTLDTSFSPYSWLNFADVGITVRGTCGIEMSALGKTVITVGTGRYEEIDITVNPTTIADYENIFLVSILRIFQPPLWVEILQNYLPIQPLF